MAESLARLVWESMSDDLADADVQAVFSALEVPTRQGMPGGRTFEELLIFQLWLHTRTVQLAFRGRAAEERICGLLDRMHEAVFEDMVHNGTPRDRLGGFEKRARDRYEEYSRAAACSLAGLGETIARHLAGTNRALPGRVVGMLATRAAETSSPLGDFLGDIEFPAEA